MSVSKSTLVVSFYISISRIFGFIRDIIIARYLGVGLLSDAFFAAFRLPNFFRRVFAEGAFNSAFIPIFIENLHDKEKDEKAFIRNIFSYLLYIIFALTIILQIFMPFFTKLIFPGFFHDPTKAELLINLSRITIFYLLFISLVSLLSGVLNSMGSFAMPSSSPIILNLTLILSVFIFKDFAPNYAYCLSYGVFIAGILQFSVLMIYTLKKKFLIYPVFPKANEDVKKFIKKIIPAVVGANVMQINLLFDSIFASMITGAVSYLYYADRINQLPLAMIGIASSIALLPTLSSKIKNKKFEEALNIQNTAIEIALILAIPASLSLIILSKEIISSLFEYGKFTSNETLNVARALSLYSLGLPAFILTKIVSQSFFASGDTKTPMKIAILCLIYNILSNLVFYFYGFGYDGIIISSVVSAYINIFLLFYLAKKNDYFNFTEDAKIKYFKMLIITILTIILFISLKKLFYYVFINKVASLFLIIFIAIFSYFLLLSLFNFHKRFISYFRK